MTFAFDAEIAAVLAEAARAAGTNPRQPIDDVFALRATTDGAFAAIMAAIPDSPNVVITEFSAVGDDGAAVPLRWYAHRTENSQAAVVYAHGGGMICGSAAQYDRLVSRYVEHTGVPFLSVDYRLAPEHAGEGLGRDVYAGLGWLRDQADALGIDPARIAIMGDSGGGAVAAAAAIMARDQGLALAKQILIYPMLDDRNVEPQPTLAPFALWNYDFNRMAWAAVLGDRLGHSDIPPHIAAARLSDFTGLAGAYIEVGELDIFRDEAVNYARGLWSAGVTCELHVHTGAPHAYDLYIPSSDLFKRVFEDRRRVICSL